MVSSPRGSSPLTRGKHDLPDGLEGFLGLIPAHAGKTMAALQVTSMYKAHPRSRGENEALAASDATDKGSSPLKRGKHKTRVLLDPEEGLIPAHAGKTRRTVRRGASAWAHPRSRGENTPV